MTEVIVVDDVDGGLNTGVLDDDVMLFGDFLSDERDGGGGSVGDRVCSYTYGATCGLR